MKILCLYLLLSIVFETTFCQVWLPLANNEQTGNPIAQTAAPTMFTQISNTGTPYITYIDDVGNQDNLGDFKAHARRLVNGQWQFAGNAISPAFPGSDYFPITLDGDVPYVAYSEPLNVAELSTRLSVRRLNALTQTWEVVGQQGFSAGSARGMAITSSKGKIFVAYSDGLEGKVTVKMFDTAHITAGWQTLGAAGLSSGFVLENNIITDNGIPYVFYFDLSELTSHVKKFSGTSWEDVGINAPCTGPNAIVRSLAFNNSHVPFLAFVDSEGAGVVRNLDTANAWVNTSSAPFDNGVQGLVSLAIVRDNIFVAFGKKENAVTQVRVKRYNAQINNWSDAGTQPVTAASSDVSVLSLVKENNKLILVFRELFGGIYAKAFDVTGALPLNTTDFYVTSQQGAALLKWNATNNLNIEKFQIQHSTNGLTFEIIGELSGSPLATPLHSYRFRHADPAQGTNYYRLKQVDKDGTYSYTGIISITFSGKQPAAMALSPNPVFNVLHVANLAAASKILRIVDTHGKVVKMIETTSPSTDIYTGNLTPGIYYISIEGFGAVGTMPFVKY